MTLFRFARVEHDGAREQEEDDDQRVVQDVAQVEHALDDVFEMREEGQRGDAVDQPLRRPALEEVE